MHQQQQRQCLTVGEVADRLRTSEATVYRYARKGRLHPVRSGRRLLFTEADVEQVLQPAGPPALATSGGNP